MSTFAHKNRFFAIFRSILELSWLTSGLGTPDTLLKALTVELGLLTLALLVQPTLQVRQ